SAFCSELTGLTQADVDGGVDFAAACAQVRDELRGRFRTWASWGEYDRRQFERQCVDGVGYPFGSRHINVKERFATAFGLRRGVTVADGYSRDKEAAQRFLARFGEEKASIHQGNIGSNDDCARVVQEVRDQHGKLDILVNNAGITVDKTVRRMTPEEWDRVIHVNLSGAFYLSRAVLEQML